MTYDWTSPKETLEQIKEYVLGVAKKEEMWYAKHRYWHSTLSRSIRFISISLFAFGILWPIIDSTQYKNFGYVSLALGSFLLLLDKYLGISTGYVRFYVAELEIKKNTLDFTVIWEKCMVENKDLTQENIAQLLEQLRQYIQTTFKTIETETNIWASEFQLQNGELYDLFKKK